MENKFKPFYREPKNINNYNFYLNLLTNKLSFKKINSIFFNIKKYFELKNYDNFVCYCFDFVREWINNNEMYTENYIENLEKIIKKLNLINKLNAFEEEYIYHFKSVIFAKKRNLKKLIVDFPLEEFSSVMWNKEEAVYYHFVDSQLIDENNNILINDCNIYLSTNRIVCSLTSSFYSFNLNEIEVYKKGKKYFDFFYKNKKYYINAIDNYEFYVSFQRIKGLINGK